MRKIARRVASRWAFQVASSGWQPPIPRGVISHHLQRVAYSPTPNEVVLNEAKTSVNILLPKLLDNLRRKMGERYYMNASVARGRVFYFFAPRHPVDYFALTLYTDFRGRVKLTFSYTPNKLNGMPDFAKSIEETATVDDPELAGLQLMRTVRAVLGKIA